MAMLVTTVVGVGGGGPLDVGDGPFEPSSKG